MEEGRLSPKTWYELLDPDIPEAGSGLDCLLEEPVSTSPFVLKEVQLPVAGAFQMLLGSWVRLWLGCYPDTSKQPRRVGRKQGVIS
jgi:hypothetical protein